MQLAVKAQMGTAGDACHVQSAAGRPTAYNLACTAVVTSRDGSVDAQVGGDIFAVTGHALISKASISQEPMPHDTLTVDGSGVKWQLASVIHSPNDAAYSCDLVRIR